MVYILALLAPGNIKLSLCREANGSDTIIIRKLTNMLNSVNTTVFLVLILIDSDLPENTFSRSIKISTAQIVYAIKTPILEV